jgi:hypothetical protein
MTPPWSHRLRPFKGFGQYVIDFKWLSGDERQERTGGSASRTRTRVPSTTGTEMYFEETAVSGISKVTALTADNASLSAGALTSLVEVDSQSGPSIWQLQADTNFNSSGPPASGVYNVGSGSSGFTLLLPSEGAWCTVSAPSGTYGISQFATAPDDSYSVTQLSMWFDMQCPGVETIRGCVRLGP